MKKHILTIAISIVIPFLFLFAQADPDDIYWSKEFAMPSQDEVRALYVDDDNVYYNEYGRLILLNKSSREYEVLGTTGGGSYRTIAKHDEKIYVGGTFESITGSKAKFLAVWDGVRWDSVGGGINGKINAICFDSDGNLWIGGTFTTAGDQATGRIAMWDGTQWHQYPGFDGEVRAIINYNNTICVAGDFEYSVDYLTVYSRVLYLDKNDNKFKDLGNKLGSESGSKVLSLTTDDKGNLYAGGIFADADGTAISENVAIYDGTSWKSLGDGLNSQVTALQHSKGILYAGGFFEGSGDNTYIKNIAKFISGQWAMIDNNSLLSGVDNPSVLCMAKDSSGHVYFGGYFTKVGFTDCWGIIEWTGSKLVGFMTTARNGTISAISDLTIDTKNDILYAGGGFVRTGNAISYGIAKYNGLDWIGCNNGLTPTSNVVYSVQALQDTIYFTGWFNYADSIRLINVAKWIDSKKTWEQIGYGIRGNDGDLGPILVLADDDIYIGGNFTEVPDGLNDTITQVNYITHWNGTKWEQMGKGLTRNDSTKKPSPEKIVRGNDGLIYVVGTFDKAGDVNAVNVASWNPQTKEWKAFESSIPGSVYTLFIDNDDFYFGGSFTGPDSLKANSIVRWNSTSKQWYKLENGIEGSVSAITKWGGDIYLTGNFPTASEVKCNSIARYSSIDNKFYPLGSGLLYGNVPGRGSSMAVYKNDLYVGGYFTTAGYKNSSSNFARWTKRPVSVEPIEPTHINDLIAYPNPAGKSITLSFDSEIDCKASIIIYDITGNFVKHI
jgi:hypothetical protein